MPDNIGNTTVGGLSDDADGGGAVDVKELDMLLPIANVGRIMKQILPSNAKISKEAKETMQECVSEFISFVTGEASEKCRKERRKTVTSEDICWAMGALSFDDYVGPLKRYLQRYRESEGEHHKANNQERANNSSGEAEDDRGIARTTQAGASSSSSSHKVGRNNTMAYGSRPF